MRFYLLACLLITASILPALIVETGSLSAFIAGSEPACAYDNWISHLAEGVAASGYNVYSPWDRQTTGFGGFNIPDGSELPNWSSLTTDFLAQNWAAVEAKILSAGFPYQLVQFHDTDASRTYYLLRETLNAQVDDNGTTETYDDETGAFAWGWGLYVLNPAGTQRIIVTAPNPCDDFATPFMCVKAFQTLNAGFLMITGAGREVAWTNSPPYTNSKSLSDPSRATNHPFYPMYTQYCTKVRAETGRREFSLQIHSYDSTLHTGYANLQISAGSGKTCPNLPIRDLSRFRHDLVNSTDYLVIPANTIGANADVYTNNYYAVQYSVHPFTFDDGTHNFAVNNSIDMPAYGANVQMLYTLSGWSDYDVFEPFFHIEMDELPNAYTQNTANFKWFYGWNEETQLWNMQHQFDLTWQYYGIWLQSLSEVIGQTLAMTDNCPPQAPTAFTQTGQTNTTATFTWTRGDDYDFDTNEIRYSTLPFPNANYSVWNRSNDSFLASPWCQTTKVTGLTSGTTYYFTIKARDKNGNVSPPDNSAPVVSNVNAVQRTDGSKIIDIFFDLADAENDPCSVSVQVSDNDGSTFALLPTDTFLSGDKGGAVSPGTGRHIVWNAGSESFYLNGSAYRFRILASDE